MASRFFFSIIFFLFLISTVEASTMLKNVTVSDSKLQLEFSKSLKKNQIKASAIKGKELTRYVFDFKNVKLSNRLKKYLKFNGDIKSVRIAQNRRDLARLVIDSKKPYAIRYYQKAKPIFYIELPNSKLISNYKKSTKHKNVKKITSAKKLFSYVSKEPVGNAAKVIDTVYSTNLKHQYKIMVDAGHGGKDSGTYWHGYKEKTLVLRIAKKVVRRLRNLGFKVEMTRSNDRFISLGGRIRKANRNKADLFISIHANSISNKKRVNIARGIETYFLQTTRNARAKRIAAKENREILKGKDSATKKVLLNAVFTGPKIALSNRLAIDVQEHMLANLRAHFKGVKDGGVRGAPFYVLVGAEMPAILIETGYLSNPKERARLFNPKYQDLQAKGIVEGVVRYLQNREKEME